jgi:hypothetical protein
MDIYVHEGKDLSNFLLYSLTKNIGLYLYRFAILKKYGVDGNSCKGRQE